MNVSMLTLKNNTDYVQTLVAIKILRTANVNVIHVVLRSSKLLKQTLMKKIFKLPLMKINIRHSEIKLAVT